MARTTRSPARRPTPRRPAPRSTASLASGTAAATTTRPVKATPPATQRGEIRLKNESIANLPSYPISRGIPLPPGAASEAGDVSIRDAAGTTLPSAGKVLQRRGDGSIEWLLVDVAVDLAPEEKKSIFIELRKPDRTAPKNPVQVRETRSGVTLSNGLTTLTLSRNGSTLIKELTILGRPVVAEGDRVDLETVDTGPKIYRATLSGNTSGGNKVSVVRANPLKGIVQIEGTHTARDGSTFLDFALRFTLAAGVPDVKIEHTFICREPNPGVTLARAIRLVVHTRLDPAAKKLVRQSHHSQEYYPRPIDVRENIEVVSSSVSDLDHYERDFKPFKMGTVFIRNEATLKEDFSKYPYHMRPGNPDKFRADYAVGSFRQVYPYLGWQSKDLTLAMSFERWDKLHPKSIAIDENVLTVSIWPEWATPCRMVQGVSKTHAFWLTGEPRAIDIDAVEKHWLRWEIAGLDPVSITFDPEWPRACQAFEAHELLRYQPRKYPFLENLIEVAPAAGNPDRFTYYRLPGAGMFHFGDIGGEGGFTNNEDDVQVLFPLLDYLRTGNMYCWDYGQETARHYMEVDFCMFSTNPRQRGGLIAHTQNHFEGMAYPSHQWSEGILLYHYLSGDERAAQVVRSVGDHYVWWTKNLLDTVVLDGREAGMPLVNLAMAHRLTGDKKYLDAAYTIIKNFHQKHYDEHGELRYPYPQFGHLSGGSYQKNLRGYGDWSSYSGLYRLWEQTGDEKIRKLLVGLLKVAVQPENFAPNDARTMDFLSVWIYMRLTGDEGIVERLKPVIPMLLKRGGHPTRRLQFLAELDKRGMIDEKLVGARGGVI